MNYDPNTFTWGYELELGDVTRTRVVPEHLGSFEHAETDIINLYGEWRGRASDPMGIDPPVGGEVNIRPTRSPEELVDRIQDTIHWFREQGDKPSAGCTNVGHVHVHVPGLIGNIEALKKLTEYIIQNQDAAIAYCWNYLEHPLMSKSKTARTYMKWDGGRTMPEWMGWNIINMAENFEDFIRIQCCGKDGVSRGRPFRYAINTYCLKHTKTVEFRLFRASLKPEEIASSIMFVKEFMNAALNTRESVKSILDRSNFTFPPFVYDHELYLLWENSKWDKERGKKERKFYEL